MGKKMRHAVLAIILCLGMLAGCGSGISADENTVFVKKDGSVVSVDVENFDANTYDEQGLKEYVEQTISEYNEENGKNLVKLKNLSVKDGQAKLTLQYASAADYRKLSGIDFFAGTLAEALAAGYTFDADFASVKDGVPFACDTGEFINDSSYKVVIIKGNTNVQVKGKIAYVSTANTKLLDGSTVSIREGNFLFGTSADTQGTEGTEAVYTETSATEAVTDTQTTGEGGAVSEDELLESSEEEEKPVFQFDDDSASNQEAASEFSEVYTYIIYQ